MSPVARFFFWDQDRPTFRLAARTVYIYATVQGNDGHLVTDLARDDFEVFDNNQPQAITVFDNDPQKITVAVMFDMSNSMAAEHPRIRAAAIALVQALWPDDRARIGSFGMEVAISPCGPAWAARSADRDATEDARRDGDVSAVGWTVHGWIRVPLPRGSDSAERGCWTPVSRVPHGGLSRRLLRDGSAAGRHDVSRIPHRAVIACCGRDSDEAMRAIPMRLVRDGPSFVERAR